MDSEIHIKTCIFEDYKQLTQELKQRGALNFPFKEKLKYLKCVGPLEMQYFKTYYENGAAIRILDAFLRNEFRDRSYKFSEDLVMLLRYWLCAIKDALLLKQRIKQWWGFLKEILTFIQIFCTVNEYRDALSVSTTECLLEIATNAILDMYQINRILKCVNKCINSNKDIRLQLFEKFNVYFVKLLQYMAICRHVDTQLTIMETVLRFMVSRNDSKARVMCAKELFDHSLYPDGVVKVFLTKPFIYVQADIREFVMTYNDYYDYAVSVLCSKITVGNKMINNKIWLDFNKELKCATITIDVKSLRMLSVPEPIMPDFLTITKNNIEKVEAANDDEAVITFTMKCDPEFLYESTKKCLLSEHSKRIIVHLYHKSDMAVVANTLKDMFHIFLKLTFVPPHDDETRLTFSNSEDDIPRHTIKPAFIRSSYATIFTGRQKPLSFSSTASCRFQVNKNTEEPGHNICKRRKDGPKEPCIVISKSSSENECNYLPTSPSHVTMYQKEDKNEKQNVVETNDQSPATEAILNIEKPIETTNKNNDNYKGEVPQLDLTLVNNEMPVKEIKKPIKTVIKRGRKKGTTISRISKDKPQRRSKRNILKVNKLSSNFPVALNETSRKNTSRKRKLFSANKEVEINNNNVDSKCKSPQNITIYNYNSDADEHFTRESYFKFKKTNTTNRKKKLEPKINNKYFKETKPKSPKKVENEKMRQAPESTFNSSLIEMIENDINENNVSKLIPKHQQNSEVSVIEISHESLKNSPNKEPVKEKKSNNKLSKDSKTQASCGSRSYSPLPDLIIEPEQKIINGDTSIEQLEELIKNNAHVATDNNKITDSANVKVIEDDNANTEKAIPEKEDDKQPSYSPNFAKRKMISKSTDTSAEKKNKKRRLSDFLHEFQKVIDSSGEDKDIHQNNLFQAINNFVNTKSVTRKDDVEEEIKFNSINMEHIKHSIQLFKLNIEASINNVNRHKQLLYQIIDDSIQAFKRNIEASINNLSKHKELLYQEIDDRCKILEGEMKILLSKKQMKSGNT